MQTFLHFDATSDYLTNDKGVIVPMTDSTGYDARAIALVKAFPINDIPLRALLDEELASKQGKDSGWFAQSEADGSTTVERRFTERRGMSYVPVTYAFSVKFGGYEPNDAAFIEPINGPATRFMERVLDA